nr:LuxR family transcriptional regulator [Cryobacterium sp. SO1]
MGRRTERAVVENLLTEAQDGRSGCLVVRGQAGIGKTALLEHAHDSAERLGFRVAGCCGVESETQFAFAGLHQLSATMLDRADVLPAPQRLALGVALGLRPGEVPDRFLVGLATLNLLAEVAEDRPLLCLIDDAHWLDEASAQVLAFVARRLAAERIVLVFAIREPAAEDDVFAFAPEIRLIGLDDTDSRILLDDGIHSPVDAHVRDRIVAEARGNPLALLELPHGAHTTELAGGFELPDVLSVPRRIEDSFRRRSAGLSADTQSLLLLGAADPTGDAALLWRAAEILGTLPAAAALAEDSGLMEIDVGVRFRHPLVRSAVYRAASPAERRRAHRALAKATDPQIDPDRSAWHGAQAVFGTNEEAAAGLERSAAHTRARGGVAAAAAFLERAMELTPDSASRARRALEAAHSKHDAGASEAAERLMDVAAAGPLDDLQRARLGLLRARNAFHVTQGSDVARKLLDAAETLAPLDAALSRETYLHALEAAMIIGGVGAAAGVGDAAEAARAAPAAPGPPRPADLLLDGLVATFTQGYAAGVPALRDALEVFVDRGFGGEDLGDMGSRRWLWLATRIAGGMFDSQRGRVLALRNVQLAREAGTLATLPGALVALSVIHVFTGEIPQAIELAAEEAEISRVTGAVPLRYAQLVVAAWRGRDTDAAYLYDAGLQTSSSARQGAESTTVHYSLAVLNNGLGNYPLALDAATRACTPVGLWSSAVGLPELVEAAVRAGQPGLATAALEELDARARASGTDWGLGLLARSRALTSVGVSAEDDYREAIHRLETCGMGAYLARTHLVYGEWLRREGKRQAARAELRLAHDLLSNMGAEAFAERAARELRATGQYPRRRSVQSTNVLTDHELQISRLVATGATSREVGAQLFLSPRTIEAHLRNIFRKLGISSRRQL